MHANKTLAPARRATTISHRISLILKEINYNNLRIKELESMREMSLRPKPRNNPYKYPFTSENALSLHYYRRDNVQAKRKLTILLKRAEALFS